MESYKLTDAIAEKIYALKKTGKYTISTICKRVNISRVTYYNWIREYDSFAALIELADKESLEEVGVLAEKSLIKKIKGYTYTEETKEVAKVMIGVEAYVANKELIVTKTVEKHVQPSDTAIIFALTNAQPERYKHRSELEHKGGIEIKKLTDEQVLAKFEEVKRLLEKQ